MNLLCSMITIITIIMVITLKFSRSKKTDPLPQFSRVFGMNLNDLVVSTGKDVPEVLVQCTTFIEKHGLVDGVYRISGISSNIKRLKYASKVIFQP